MILIALYFMIFQSGSQVTSIGLDRTAIATLLAGAVAFFVAEATKRGFSIEGKKAFYLAVTVSILIALAAVTITIDWQSGNILSNVINAVLGAFGLATLIFKTLTAMSSNKES